MAEIIDFKNAIKVKNSKKINELKEDYIDSLNRITLKDEKEIDEWFLSEYALEIQEVGLEQYIKEYMQEWKKECSRKSKKIEIDKSLLDEIEQELDEKINTGLDKDTIISVLCVKFSRKLPSNIQSRKFLSDMYDNYYDKLMGR